jgi:hypothetical protein
MLVNGSTRSAGLILASLVLMVATVDAGPRPRFNARGNLLIVDQYNNRVIEVDTNAHAIVWKYEMSVARSVTNRIVGPRDAERLGGLTLIVGGGLPAGVSTNYPDGSTDNRVIEVNHKGKIVWQYGQAGVTGGGDNELNNPVAAMILPHKSVLITDQGNQRVIQVSRKGKISWQYGTTGVSGSASNQLNHPASAQHFGNGHYLIADAGNNRVIEVNRRNEIVWQYGDPADTSVLNGPTYACRLPHGGNILITDSLNNRIMEIDKNGSNVFTFVTSARPDSVLDPQPTRAVQLKTGNFLIADQFNHQVIEIDASGVVAFIYGTIGVSGSGDGLLAAPCDAKVVGDFTGLTSPKGGGGGGGFNNPFPF